MLEKLTLHHRSTPKASGIALHQRAKRPTRSASGLHHLSRKAQHVLLNLGFALPLNPLRTGLGNLRAHSCVFMCELNIFVFASTTKFKSCLHGALGVVPALLILSFPSLPCISGAPRVHQHASLRLPSCPFPPTSVLKSCLKTPISPCPC